MGGHVCPQRRHPFPDQEPPVQLCLDLSVSENGAVIRMVYVFMKAVVQGEMTGRLRVVQLLRQHLRGCLFFRILLLFPGLYAMEKKHPGRLLMEPEALMDDPVII